MRRAIVFTTAVSVLVTLHPAQTAASTETRVTGGGTGTFGTDLDADGDVDGSQFAMAIRIAEDGSARGRFLCLMAGRSDFLGLAVMSVAGPVTEGSASGDTATFEGTARIGLGEGEAFTDVPFRAVVTEGGPGVGTLQLTVIGAFDGVPGDTDVGNADYDLPVETVATGAITMG